MEDHRAHNTRLMDRAAGGEEASFGDLARQVQDELFRFALAQGLRRADAAEAVQEALLRAWLRRGRWRPGADATAWLYGFTMNVVRELRRKRRRDGPSGLDLSDFAGPEPSGADDAELARLPEHLAALPPRQREAVACRYLRQMSVRDTAAAMGCAEGTVKAAVFAGLRNLRAAMRQATGTTVRAR